MKILPQFQGEADALARLIAMRLDPKHYNLTTDAPKDIVRAIAEALQSAYEAKR